VDEEVVVLVVGVVVVVVVDEVACGVLLSVFSLFTLFAGSIVIN
jgi:hypothetical protein